MSANPDFMAMLQGAGAEPVQEDPYSSDFKRMIRGVAGQPETKRSVLPAVDVSNTATSVSVKSPDPNKGWLPAEQFNQMLRDKETGTPGGIDAQGVYQSSRPAPINSQRQALIDSVTAQLRSRVESGNPIFYKAQAAKAQEIATLTALLRGLESQSYQEQSGADLPAERESRIERAQALTEESRARRKALTQDEIRTVGRSLLRIPRGGGSPEVLYEDAKAEARAPQPHLEKEDTPGGAPNTVNRRYVGLDPYTGQEVWTRTAEGLYKGDSLADIAAKAGASAAAGTSAREAAAKPYKDADAAADRKTAEQKAEDTFMRDLAVKAATSKLTGQRTRAAETLKTYQAAWLKKYGTEWSPIKEGK